MEKNVIKSDRHAAIVANRIEKELRAEFNFIEGVKITREKWGAYRVIKCSKCKDHVASGFLTSTFVRTAIEYIDKIAYSDSDSSGIFWNIETDHYMGEVHPVFAIHVWYKHEVE